MSNKLQNAIMDFLADLQANDIIYISNNDEASAIGAELWMVLRGKIDDKE